MKARLRELIEQWEREAINYRTDPTTDPEYADKMAAKGDVYAECAAALKELIA